MPTDKKSGDPPPLSREEQAADIWATIRELAVHYPTPAAQQDALGLGRGAGRVRAMMALTDGPLTLTALAEAAAIDAPYATLVVDSLEARNLVARKPDPTDRRRKLVKLTPTGKRATAKLAEVQRQPPPGFASLTDRDLTTLGDLIARIAAAED
jgi:DNA-binding MarR family transcriptional regulator